MDPNVVAKYTPAAMARSAHPDSHHVHRHRDGEPVRSRPPAFTPMPTQHGEDWERPSSIELLDPTNARARAGSRKTAACASAAATAATPASSSIPSASSSGATTARPSSTTRCSRTKGANEFDTFDLRTSQNYAWPRGRKPAKHDTMVREVFCRETLGAMGQPYRRSRYYHLYLNGQYWGLYETDERPEASYGETYFGGDKDDYDVVKCANHVGGFVTEATDGNFTAWSNLWTMVGVAGHQLVQLELLPHPGLQPRRHAQSRPAGHARCGQPHRLHAGDLLQRRRRRHALGLPGQHPGRTTGLA